MTHSPNRTASAALLLLLAAAPPRLFNLNSLSFYADEETTALPARALAEGHGSTMPSGMSYRRALPYTWLNAASVKIFGAEDEFGYRLPAAVLGTITVPLLFILGRSFVGAPAAMVASVFLAFSEWHIVFSRQARMYVPFLFFFLAACYWIWRWAERGTRLDLLTASVLFMLAVSIHFLGIFAIGFAPIANLASSRPTLSSAKLLIFTAAMAATALAYNNLFVGAGFRAMGAGSGAVLAALSLEQAVRVQPTITSSATITALFAVFGAAIGVWASVRVSTEDSGRGSQLRMLGRLVAAGTAGALAAIGQLYGAALAAMIFLLIYADNKAELSTRMRLPALALTLPIVGWSTYRITSLGLRSGLVELIKFPFPYPVLLAEAFPLIALLFLGASFWLAAHAHDAANRGLRACVLFTLLVLVALGSVSRWGGLRYLFPTYMFLLLVAGWALVEVLRAVGRSTRVFGFRLPLALSVLIATSGLAKAHGLPQAIRMVTLEHGEPVAQSLHMYPFRPDHEAAGEFVHDRRKPGDVVIAEDPLQQYWYAGRVDFWFRSLRDSQKFLYIAEDGRIRDIYVNSAPVSDPAAIDSIMAAARGRVWFITSGETQPHRSIYLSAAQQRWLDSLEANRRPNFVARDGVTRVYCLNC